MLIDLVKKTIFQINIIVI
jgi:hypothetical protein